MVARRNRPVFVIGCPRSGTNLLYDTLLSAGGFAVYRGRLLVYQVLIPRFGRIDRLKDRAKMVTVWLRSKGFRRSGLDRAELAAKLMEDCHSGGDFVRSVMGEIARKQGVNRWAVYDPENVVRIEVLKREIPEALFVHIIRDARDVALSLRKLREFNPLPWSKKPRSLEEHALFWEWMVQRGLSYREKIADDYTEVRYEDLVANPKRTLDALSRFLDHELDYRRILSTSLGTMSRTNSSFGGEPDGGASPVGRWKQRLRPQEVTRLEWYVGKTLERTGYALTGVAADWRPRIRDKFLRAVYPSFLNTKQRLKDKTVLRRLSNTCRLELTAEEEDVFSSSSPA